MAVPRRCSLRDLPADFGPWQTVWKRHYRWSTDGTYQQIFLAVQEALGPTTAATDTISLIVSTDSTSVRAHQHSAGARHDGLASTTTGGRNELHEYGPRA